MKTAEKLVIAAGGILILAAGFAGIRKLVKKYKKPEETQEPIVDEPKTVKALVVNVETKDLSIVVLEKGEEVEDKTLAVIDTLHDFREYSVLKSIKAKRNIAKIKEANLEVGEVADVWFRIKEQRDTITPEQITNLIREVCDKKLEKGEQ